MFLDDDVDSFVESDCLPGTTTDNKYFVFDELVSTLIEGNFNWFHLVDHVLTKENENIINQLSKEFPNLLEKCVTSA